MAQVHQFRLKNVFLVKLLDLSDHIFRKRDNQDEIAILKRMFVFIF